MASQEFLVSFGVEIDEAGVTRLQKALEENRILADNTAAVFDAAASAIRTFAEELGLLPDFSGRGITTEGLSGFGGLSPGLDLTQAKKELEAFIREAKKPIPLSGNGSGITSAGQSAYNSIKSLFSTPITIRVKAAGEETGDGAGDGNGESSTVQRMSAGGRFTKPTDVQVAEDGDAEYIIPVKKEDRAVPLLRRLLAELSPEARESLTGDSGTAKELPEAQQPLTAGMKISDKLPAEAQQPFALAAGTVPDSLSAGTVSVGTVTQDNRTVTAPVNIQVQSTGANAEQIGRSPYDTAERYLLRTLRSAFPG